VLVSSGDDGDVVLSHQTGRCLGRLPTDTVQGKQPPIQSLAFSSGSRYLCSGGDTMMVDVWDLKKKERTRSFSGHTAPLTAIVFGKSDARVASASRSGDILVHSVVTGTTVCKVGSGSDPVRHLEYSQHRSHLLASGGDAASLDLWDTNTSALVKSFANAHTAPINQVGFSPVASSLLSSVSFDKRMLFYDLNTQRVVKQMQTDYPLTSFNFHSNGTTVVVGTMNGHLLSYDLRKSDQPSHKIASAHSGPVHCVKFQNARAKRRDSVDTTYTTSTPGAASPSLGGGLLSPSASSNAGTPRGTPAASAPAPFATPFSRRSPAITPASVVQATPQPTQMQQRSPQQPSSAPVGILDKEVQESLIRTAVGEAMGELRASLKEDLNNLHLELLRQFHVQQVEIRTILQGFTDKHTGLVDEIKGLREEYEELKHIY
jgi:hypothetical protein